MKYDRITEIIRPFSGVEFVPAEILETAGNRGTRVHTEIQSLLSGWEFHMEQPDIQPYIDSFNAFWSSHSHLYKKGKVTLEKRLYCDQKQITGQIDVIIETEGRTYLIDWKTSASKHKSWYLQGAAYKHLCEVNGYTNVDNVLFVQLNKHGKKPTLHKSEDHEENIDMFFKCIEIYRYFDMKNTRKPWSKR